MKHLISAVLLALLSSTAIAQQSTKDYFGKYANETLDSAYTLFFGEDKVHLNLQGRRIDKIVVRKSKRELILMHKNIEVGWYEISLGSNPTGPKRFQGDKRTPEGSYKIVSKQKSQYHLALRVSYPNAQDTQYARAKGLQPGGDIMIHGIKNGYAWVGRWHRIADWTLGCVALTNEEIEEIYSKVSNGTTVEILP